MRFQVYIKIPRNKERRAAVSKWRPVGVHVEGRGAWGKGSTGGCRAMAMRAKAGGRTARKGGIPVRARRIGASSAFDAAEGDAARKVSMGPVDLGETVATMENTTTSITISRHQDLRLCSILILSFPF